MMERGFFVDGREYVVPITHTKECKNRTVKQILFRDAPCRLGTAFMGADTRLLEEATTAAVSVRRKNIVSSLSGRLTSFDVLLGAVRAARKSLVCDESAAVVVPPPPTASASMAGAPPPPIITSAPPPRTYTPSVTASPTVVVSASTGTGSGAVVSEDDNDSEPTFVCGVCEGSMTIFEKFGYCCVCNWPVHMNCAHPDDRGLNVDLLLCLKCKPVLTDETHVCPWRNSSVDHLSYLEDCETDIVLTEAPSYHDVSTNPPIESSYHGQEQDVLGDSDLAASIALFYTAVSAHVVDPSIESDVMGLADWTSTGRDGHPATLEVKGGEFKPMCERFQRYLNAPLTCSCGFATYTNKRLDQHLLDNGQTHVRTNHGIRIPLGVSESGNIGGGHGLGGVHPEDTDYVGHADVMDIPFGAEITQSDSAKKHSLDDWTSTGKIGHPHTLEVRGGIFTPMRERFQKLLNAPLGCSCGFSTYCNSRLVDHLVQNGRKHVRVGHGQLGKWEVEGKAHVGDGARTVCNTGMVGGLGRVERDVHAEPGGDRVGVCDGTRVEDGACDVHEVGSEGGACVRGDGATVEDISDMCADRWDSGDTGGGPDGGGAGRECHRGMVGGLGRVGSDAEVEPGGDRVGVNDGTRVEPWPSDIHRTVAGNLVTDVDPYGNCFFLCIVAAIHPTEQDRWDQLAAILRAEVVTYMSRNADVYAPHLPHTPTRKYPLGMNWNQYLRYMSTDETWGDELTTSATSCMLGTRIRVYWINPETLVFEAYVGGGEYGGDLPATARLVNLVHINNNHFGVLPGVVVNVGIRCARVGGAVEAVDTSPPTTIDTVVSSKVDEKEDLPSAMETGVTPTETSSKNKQGRNQRRNAANWLAKGRTVNPRPGRGSSLPPREELRQINSTSRGRSLPDITRGGDTGEEEEETGKLLMT